MNNQGIRNVWRLRLSHRPAIVTWQPVTARGIRKFSRASRSLPVYKRSIVIIIKPSMLLKHRQNNAEFPADERSFARIGRDPRRRYLSHSSILLISRLVGNLDMCRFCKKIAFDFRLLLFLRQTRKAIDNRDQGRNPRVEESRFVKLVTRDADLCKIPRFVYICLLNIFICSPFSVSLHIYFTLKR